MDVFEYARAVEIAIMAEIPDSQALCQARMGQEAMQVSVDLVPDDPSGKPRLWLEFDIDLDKADYDTDDVTATLDYVIADYES